MNRDLEAQLDEMGPAYREVVDRLRAAYGPCGAAAPRPRAGRVAVLAAAGLLAASVLVCLCFGVFVREASAAGRSAYTLAYLGDAASLDELVRTQNPDGSWGNDFLTCQNAAALRGHGRALVAYRRALRYLRSRGLKPLSDGELRVRGDFAAQAVSRG